MSRVLRSHLAATDLLEIWLHIGRVNEKAADRFLDRFARACAILAETPEAGRSREELSPGLRSFPIGRYVIFYRARKSGIEVARVLHGSRDLDLLF